MNSPYGRFAPPFVRKAVEEFKSGRIEQAVILLNVNHIATRWFNDAMQVEHLICLPRTLAMPVCENLNTSQRQNRCPVR